MTAAPAYDQQLPVLRPDLEFFSGPEDLNGSPTWTIHDPLTGVYRKLGWAEAAILRRLRTAKTLGYLLVELAATSSLRIAPQEVLALCQQAEAEQLTVTSSVGDVDRLQAIHDAARPHPVKWLLMHYHYIRVPLLHPDGFLTRSLPYVRWLASRAAFCIYSMAFLLGLFRALPRTATYLSSFPLFFNPRGLVYYFLAIITIKAIHEFTHAYVAKYYGVRVPTMGIAFLVLCPVAFCNVTDAWRLSSRRQRFWISAAGITAELVIAGVSLLFWGIAPTGPLQGLFFILSSVTLASTLLVNLNPAMRFDGYYILGDLWGIENLQPRAFAMTRWALRKWLVGITIPPPEERVSRRRLLGMIVYSVYAWLYRVGLYISIAVLVYYKFTKTLGIILFAFEIGFFLVRPILMEGRTLLQMRQHVRWSRRLQATLLVLGAVFLWAALPLRREISLTAIVTPSETHSQTIYSSQAGVVEALHVQRNTAVQQGRPLVRIRREEVDTEISILEHEAAILELALLSQSLEEERRALLAETREQLRQVKARLRALAEEVDQSTVVAQVQGTVYEWNQILRQGQTVQRGEILGRIARLQQNRILAFVQEDYVSGIKPGDRVWFTPAGVSGPLAGEVETVDPLRQQTVQHLVLSSAYQGELPVRRTQDGRLIPLGSYYQVRVCLAQKRPPLRIGQTGYLWAKTTPRSRLLDGLRQVWRVLIRESGF